MGSNYSLTYNVDIVLCIDKTGSMRDLMDTVKRRALNFYRDLSTLMQKKNKNISQLRLKLIAFGDYLADGKLAMLSSPDFYNIPSELEDFKEMVMGIEADGGGDDPEDAMEALWFAITSNWTKGGSKRRHIIAVWTDAPAHDLGFGRAVPNYPKEIVKNFGELTALWESGKHVDNEAKRLLIYAPNEGYWNKIAETWDEVIFYPSNAGKGLKEVEYDELLNVIANSI